MPLPLRAAVIGMLTALCAAVAAALGIGTVPFTATGQTALAQIEPDTSGLSSSGEIRAGFFNGSDGQFPQGARGIRLDIDADVTVTQQVAGADTVMRRPSLLIEIEGDGARFDDALGGGTRREVALGLSSKERFCRSEDGWSCTIRIERSDIVVPALRVDADAGAPITIRASLRGFGLHLKDRPDEAIGVPPLEGLSFSDTAVLTVDVQERISDPRLAITFPDDDADTVVTAGVGSDGTGGVRIGLAVEFGFAPRPGETVSNLVLRLDSYGRIEVPRLLGSTVLAVEKSGLGGLSLGACREVSAERQIWHCGLSGYTATARVPADLAPGDYAISGNARLLGIRVQYDVTESGSTYSEDKLWEDFESGSAMNTLTVAAAEEVHSATFALDTDQPQVIDAQTGQTRLVLGVLNEDGSPSHPKQIASILVTTTAGSLSRGGQVCGTTCNVTREQLDQLSRSDIGKLQFALAAGRPGDATVSATVIAAAGGKRLTLPTIEIRFLGPAVAINVGRPSGSLHHVVGAQPVSMSIGAVDANGAATRMPALTVSLLDSKGQAVPKGRMIARVLTGQVVLTSLAPLGSGLTPGAYQLRLSGGGITVERPFRVAGAAARISVDAQPARVARIGQIMAATVRVTDAQSQPIADGQAIEFRITSGRVVRGVGSSTVLSKDGAATYRFATLRGGTAVVVISVGNVAEVLRIASNAPVPDYRSPLISEPLPDGRALWLGGSGQASYLVPRLRGSGVSGLWALVNGVWTGYATGSDGTVLPGSTGFAIREGDLFYPIR